MNPGAADMQVEPRPEASFRPDPALADVLVISFRKSFWASRECEVFPTRLYGRIFLGHSTNLFNTVVLTLRALAAVARRRPRLIFFGSAPRLVPLFLILRRLGLLPARIVATNQVYFGRRFLPWVDRVIVYSTDEAKRPDKHVYLPIPADGDFASVVPHRQEQPYVFTGGGTLRDFASLIEAVRPLPVQLKLVTFSERSLGYDGKLPPNCELRWRMPLEEFLSLAAGSLFVVVPLRAGRVPHGHTTIAQALSLGKAVVTTRGTSVGDYVRHEQEGLLVEPGDVAGYRNAITRLLEDEPLRLALERNARARAPEFSYAAFAQSIRALCLELLGTPAGGGAASRNA